MVSKAPKIAQWIATHSKISWDDKQGEAGSSTSSANKPPQLTETGRDEVAKSGNIRHVIYNKAPNFHVEIWIKDNHEFFFRPDLKGPIYTPLETLNNPYKIELDRDFPDFDWISPANFCGIEKINNRECLVFLSGSTSSNDNQKTNREVLLQDPYAIYRAPSSACVDLQSRLPVLIKEGDEIIAYQFSSSPQTITLPNDLQTLLDNQEKAHKQMISMPGRPY